MSVSIPTLPPIGGFEPAPDPSKPRPSAAFALPSASAREANHFFKHEQLDGSSAGIEKLGQQIATMLNKEFFRQLDADGSGSISRAEFSRVLRNELGLNVEPGVMKKIFQSFDRDNSGSVAYEELHEMLSAQHRIDLSVTPRHFHRLKAKLQAYHQLLRVRHRRPLPVSAVSIRLDEYSSLAAFEILSGEQSGAGTFRCSDKLAIVAHPMTGGQFNSDTPALRAAYSVLHRLLVEAQWNVLAIEANDLGAIDAQAESGRLQAAMEYVARHRKLRYCKVALLAQGTGATAAIGLAADIAPPQSDTRLVDAGLVCISACQPSGTPAALDELRSVLAPRCRVPVLISYLDEPSELSHALALAESLPTEVETIAVPMGSIPTYGATRRFQPERLYGASPEPLLDFLERAVDARAWSMRRRARFE